MDGRWLVVESCIRPSGAYAKTLERFTNKDQAKEAYRTAFFQGPGFGIITRKQIQLVYTEMCPRVWHILATRSLD